MFIGFMSPPSEAQRGHGGNAGSPLHACIGIIIPIAKETTINKAITTFLVFFTIDHSPIFFSYI